MNNMNKKMKGKCVIIIPEISRKDLIMKYSIRVNEVKKEDSNVRAFVTVVFGDSFKITNIAIVENKDKG